MPLSLFYLFIICLIFSKAFLELQTHEEALAMANYYKRKPAILHGKEMQVYLSKELIGIKVRLIASLLSFC